MNGVGQNTGQPTLTVQLVEARVAFIAAIARGEVDCSSTDAKAHAEEDRLFADVLRSIAGGTDHAGALARAALKSSEIEFSRWYE